MFPENGRPPTAPISWVSAEAVRNLGNDIKDTTLDYQAPNRGSVVRYLHQKVPPGAAQ